MTVEWTSRARRDLEAQLDFIALDKPSAAERMAALVEKTTRLLAVQPRMGKAGRVRTTLEFVVPQTPFLLVYRVQDERVTIMRLLHGAQNYK